MRLRHECDHERRHREAEARRAALPRPVRPRAPPEQHQVGEDVGAEEAPHAVPPGLVGHPLIDGPPVLVRHRADADLGDGAREAKRARGVLEPRGRRGVRGLDAGERVAEDRHAHRVVRVAVLDEVRERAREDDRQSERDRQVNPSARHATEGDERAARADERRPRGWDAGATSCSPPIAAATRAERERAPVGGTRDATPRSRGARRPRRGIRGEVDVPGGGVRLHERHGEEGEHREVERHREPRTQEPGEERNGRERDEVRALRSPGETPEKPLAALAEEGESVEARRVRRVKHERVGRKDAREARARTAGGSSQLSHACEASCTRSRTPKRTGSAADARRAPVELG